MDTSVNSFKYRCPICKDRMIEIVNDDDVHETKCEKCGTVQYQFRRVRMQNNKHLWICTNMDYPEPIGPPDIEIDKLIQATNTRIRRRKQTWIINM